MTIRRGLALVALIALLAGLWWGLGVDDAGGPARRDGATSGDASREAPALPDQEGAAGTVAGTIRGTVIAGGGPVSARVELRRISASDVLLPARLGLLRPTKGPALAIRRSTADGRFLFADLEPGRYELRATGPAGNAGRLVVTVDAPEIHESVVLRVPIGACTFAGQVLWADGRPFVGEVWAGNESGPRSGDVVRTDGSGYFELRGVDVGFTFLSAGIANRWFFHLGSARLPTDERPVYRVGENAREFTGRVVDAATGRPVPGATVLVDPYECDWVTAATTGEDGAFRVKVPTAGTGRFVVFAAGYATLDTYFGEFPDDVTLRLLRTAVITGRVLAASTREPVAGITVSSAPRDEGLPGSEVRSVSDREGKYCLEGLAPGWRRLTAGGRGFVSVGAADRGTGAESALIVDATSGGEIAVDLLVVPGATVAGRVLDHEDRGVPGAIVEFTLVDPRSEGHATLFEPSVVTDGAGRFRVAGLAPGLRYSGTAFAGLAHVSLDDFYLPAVGRDDLVVRLPEFARFEAVVTEEGTGRPVPGATVSFAPKGGEHPTFSTRCGPDGRAVRYAPRDQVRVVRARHGSYRYPVEWTPVPETGPVGLVLRKGAAVAGHIRVPEGILAAGILVAGQQAVDESNRGRTYTRVCRTGADGAFRLEGYRPGRLVLRLTYLRDGATVEVGVLARAPVTDLELSLPDLTNVEDLEEEGFEVLVLDPDGRPIPSAFVNALDRGWIRTKADFASLGSGRTELGVSREDFDAIEVHSLCDFTGRPLPFGAVLVRDIPRDAKSAVVRVGPEERISGRVVTGAGRGLRGVAVSAYRSHGPSSSRHARAVTGEDGGFELRGLDDGIYSLSIEVPAGSADPGPLSARGGEKDVTITLPAGRTVEVRVVDGDGGPVAGASLYLREERGRQIDTARSGAEGWAALARVPMEGGFSLTVRPPGDRSDLTYLRREPWPPSETTVVLGRELSVTGRVIDDAGSPVAGARVRAEGAGDRHESADTWKDGSFRVEGLAAGPVSLRASVFGPEGNVTSEALVVPAGSENVSIVLRPSPALRIRVAGEIVDPDRWWVRLIRTEGAKPYESLDGELDSAGRVVFRGLDAKTGYSLWIRDFASDRCFYQGGLLASDEEVVVRPVPGRSIRGRVVVPGGVKAADVDIELLRREQYGDDADADERGEFRFTGLPAGLYRVIATAEDAEDNAYIAEAHVEAGGTIVLTLRRSDVPDDE